MSVELSPKKIDFSSKIWIGSEVWLLISSERSAALYLNESIFISEPVVGEAQAKSVDFMQVEAA